MASSAGLTPLPTSVHHSTTRLTHSQAHSFLSAFLDLAENDAAYRPDSTLTERGPQALSSGSTPNLTLSHLKRILSGMEGKRIGGSLGLEKEAKGKGENGADGELEGVGESDEGHTPRKSGCQKRTLNEDETENGDPQTPKSKKQKRKIIYSVNSEGVEDPQEGADVEADTPGPDRGDDDWQDAETYALAQTKLDYDEASAAEDQLEFEDEDEDGGRELEEQEATEVDDPDAAETQSHTAVRKRKQRGGDEDADEERGDQKANKKTKKAADTVVTDRTTTKSNQNMSKEERKKLKKMRQKDEKKERQREREEKNKNR